VVTYNRVAICQKTLWFKTINYSVCLSLYMKQMGRSDQIRYLDSGRQKIRHFDVTLYSSNLRRRVDTFHYYIRTLVFLYNSIDRN